MKVSCLQENLSRGLSIVGRAVALKSPLPITSNILLQTDQSRLKLSATNLEIGITCWIGAKVEEEGAIAVPARLITEFINSLPNERVDLNVTCRASARTLLLRCMRVEARINGVDAEDFPPVPTADGQPTTTVEPGTLREAINQVAFAAATDDSRPVLTGVHCKFAGDRLTLAAADGFRLAVRTLPLLQPVEEEMELIMPARTLSELSRILAAEEEPVELIIRQNKSQILIHLTNVEMVSQLMQGSFPNYAQLIPQSYASRAVVNVAQFRESTKIASIFARDSSGTVRLQAAPGDDLLPGKMTISSRSDEVGDNVDEIDAIVEGEESKIAFNAKYLGDVLGVLTTQQVALETNGHTSPGVLRPIGTDNYVHVIMPMFVQW